jgi:protein TonB
MTRRSIVAAISMIVHAVVLFFALTADLWRPITQWPTPRSAMAFVEDVPRRVHLEDIELPKSSAPRAATTTAAQPTLSARSIEAAPITPPSGIANETGGEKTLVGGGRLADVESSGSELTSIGVDVAPPPPPAARGQTPIRLSSGIRAPQRVVNVAPVYPVIARSAHVQGMVIIEATIDEGGNVVRTAVLRSIPLIDDAALTAVRQWKFSPTLLNGVPVPIVMTVTVNFKLD